MKPDGQKPQRLSQGEEYELVREAADDKKPFVEPEVSCPVDVLESTTFFQAADSGGTP